MSMLLTNSYLDMPRDQSDGNSVDKNVSGYHCGICPPVLYTSRLR